MSTEVIKATVAQNNHTASAAGRGPASVRDSKSGMRDSRSVIPKRATSNQAMQQALRNGSIQAKLTVNTPNDEFEREADRVADQVMGMSAGGASETSGDPPPNIQRACSSCSKKTEPDPVQRTCKDCDEELKRKEVSSEAVEISQAAESPPLQRMCSECDEELKRKERNSSSSEISTQVESQIMALQSGGYPLPETARSFFEPRFGRNFGNVRVHTAAHEAATASQVNALAYTVGSHIVFAQGQYAPETTHGRRLLAHELTHIVQQSESRQHNLIQQASCPGPADQNGDQPVEPSRECTPRSDTVGGAQFLFCADSDQMEDASASLLPQYIPRLKNMGVVEVHGYASPDGPKGREVPYNLNLSCRRANRAADMLTAAGIPSSQITTFKHGGTTAYGSTAQNRNVMIPIPNVHDFAISAVSLLACAPCSPFTDDGAIALNPPALESSIPTLRQKHSIAAQILSVDGRHIDPGSPGVTGVSKTLGTSEYCGNPLPAFQVSGSAPSGAGTTVTSANNIEGRRWESELSSRVGAVVPCTLFDPFGQKPGAPCGFLGNNNLVPPIGNRFFLELYADGTSTSGFMTASGFPFHYLYERGQLKMAGGNPVHPKLDFDAWATSTGVSKNDAIIGFRAMREACCQGRLPCPCTCRNGQTEMRIPPGGDPAGTLAFCIGTFAHFLVGSCPASCKPAGTVCSTLNLPANS